MTVFLVVLIGLALALTVSSVSLYVRERRRRRDTHDELTLQRIRNRLLEDDVPFPRGETLP